MFKYTVCGKVHKLNESFKQLESDLEIASCHRVGSQGRTIARLNLTNLGNTKIYINQSICSCYKWDKVFKNGLYKFLKAVFHKIS